MPRPKAQLKFAGNFLKMPAPSEMSNERREFGVRPEGVTILSACRPLPRLTGSPFLLL